MRSKRAAVLLTICSVFLFMAFPDEMRAEEPKHNERVFKDDALTNMSELLRRLEEATSDDVKWAAFHLKLGHESISRGQWSGAAKSFAEAAMLRPTPRTLLNRAFTYANTRTGGTCDEEAEARIRIAGNAFHYFNAGLDMHKILGAKSDLDDAAIIDFHKKMLDAQKRLLDFQRKCFEQRKNMSTRK